MVELVWKAAKDCAVLAFAFAGFFNHAAGFSAALMYTSWRSELERAILFKIADVILLSLDNATGTYALRRRSQRR